MVVEQETQTFEDFSNYEPHGGTNNVVNFPFKTGQFTQDTPDQEIAIYEATEHPRQILYQTNINMGERVKIKVVREKINPLLKENEYGNNEDNSSKDDDYVKRLFVAYSENIHNLAQTEKQLFSSKEEVLLLRTENNIIREELNEMKSKIANKSQHLIPSILNKFSNICISIFMISTITFLILATFSIAIPRTDAVFGIFLSILSGSFFYLDKFYRRHINKCYNR